MSRMIKVIKKHKIKVTVDYTKEKNICARKNIFFLIEKIFFGGSTNNFDLFLCCFF